MAPVTGKFQADFRSFYDAVEKAQVSLRSFESDSSKVEKRLNAMADSFSGRRVIQEATLMAEAIKEAGGTSRLTASELQRAGSVGEEAAQKLRALGIDVPVGIQKLADSIKKASEPIVHMAGHAENLSQHLDRVRSIADRFGGDAAIRNAHEYAKAIEQIGGVTRLTAKDQAEVNVAVREAMAVYRNLGEKAPAEIVAIAQATQGAASANNDAAAATQTLSSTYRQFDGILQSIGVNIGPYVKGLEDVVALGATTGVVLGGVALATKAVVGYIEAQAKAGLEAQEMAARSDVLARAFYETGRVVTDVNQAIKINEDALRKRNNASIDWEARMMAARDAAADLTAEEIKQIETARALGATTEQLKDKFGVTAETLVALDKQMQVTTSNEEKMAAVQKQLSEQRLKNLEKERKAHEDNARRMAGAEEELERLRLEMTGTSIERKLKQIDEAYEKEVAKLNKLDAEYEKHVGIQQQIRDQAKLNAMSDIEEMNEFSRSALQQRADREKITLDAMLARSGEFSAAQIAQQRETWFAALESLRNFGLEGGQVFEDLANKAKMEAARIDEFMKAATMNMREAFTVTSDVPALTGFALDEVISRYSTPGQQGNKASALANALAQLEAMEGRYRPTDNASFFAMQRDQILLAQLRKLKGSGKIPGFADGVENFEGGLAYVHKNEVLVNMPKGTSVIPASRTGGGPVFNVTIYASTKQGGESAGRGFVTYMRKSGQLVSGGVGA